MALAVFATVGAADEGTAPGAHVSVTWTAKVTISKDDQGRCRKVVVDDLDVGGLDVVEWAIHNKDCSGQKRVNLEKFVRKASGTEENLFPDCNLKRRVDPGKTRYVTCKVENYSTTDAIEYKYNIGGDVDVDPKLIIRPPASFFCKMCEERCKK